MFSQNKRETYVQRSDAYPARSNDLLDVRTHTGTIDRMIRQALQIYGFAKYRLCAPCFDLSEKGRLARQPPCAATRL